PPRGSRPVCPGWKTYPCSARSRCRSSGAARREGEAGRVTPGSGWGTANDPGARDEPDPPVGSGRQPALQVRAQRLTPPGTERRNISRSRPRPAKKRLPVVGEGLETGRDLDATRPHLPKTCVSEDLPQHGRPAHREASAFVEAARTRVECDGLVPEGTEKLHPAAVI